MTVKIELKPEIEIQVLAEASAQGVSVESLLAAVIESNFPTQSNLPFYERASAEEWSRSFSEWAASHPLLPNPADDSRESIYEGCGE